MIVTSREGRVSRNKIPVCMMAGIGSHVREGRVSRNSYREQREREKR